MKLPPKPNKIEKGQLWASSDLKNVWLTCEKRGSDRVYMSLVNCTVPSREYVVQICRPPVNGTYYITLNSNI